MPAIPEVLSALIVTNVSNNIKKLGGNPLGQPNPTHFLNMCEAIGKGIAQGTPVISFTTSDSGMASIPPIPGTGVGLGIQVDADYMSQKMYTNVRDLINKTLGNTNHEPWPPSPKTSGEYLKAITDGTAKSIKEHYAVSWVLNSAHPLIYLGTGTIDEGKFTGIVDIAVSSLMTTYGTMMIGKAWPLICKGIAQGYKDGIEHKTKSTVTITGICIPGPSQICAIANSTGTGIGTAT